MTKEVNGKLNTKKPVNCLVSDNMECLLTVDLYAPIVDRVKNIFNLVFATTCLNYTKIL